MIKDQILELIDSDGINGALKKLPPKIAEVYIKLGSFAKELNLSLKDIEEDIDDIKKIFVPAAKQEIKRQLDEMFKAMNRFLDAI